MEDDILNENDLNCSNNQSNLMKFFYTFDKSIQNINDSEIFQEISKRYTNFQNKELADSVLKKTILEFFENEEFINYLIEYFDVTIMDLVTLLYRQFKSIFSNTLFIKKIKSVIIKKSYNAKNC